MSQKRGRLRSFFSAAYESVDATRRFFFNLLFVLLLGMLLVWLLSSDKPDVPAKGALVVAPRGNIVEQLEGSPMDRAMAKMLDQEIPQTLLRDLVDAIELAGEDQRISMLHLKLDNVSGAGLPSLQRLRDAIEKFRQSGKPIIASADSYGQSAYHIAAQADRVYLNPMGDILLEGYGRFKTYYKTGLDRLQVDWNVFRVGEYKSAVEPYLRDSMSDEAKTANQEWLGDLWRNYLEDIATRRQLPIEELTRGTEQLPQLVEESEGDLARALVKAGLVDELIDRESLREELIKLAGKGEEQGTYSAIGVGDYLKARADDRGTKGSSDSTVAVLVAVGGIRNGDQPPGTIGGDSTAKMIREARLDDKVKAVVLRVDSGGGSAFASEVIRDELKRVRMAGKPVVVSMGSVAASGGYWIATASDEIWASPSTITGSIGIFGMFPTYQRTLSTYLGMHVDGVGTTPLSGALRPDRKINPQVASILQTVIQHGYRQFLERVAEARSMSIEQVDAIARGRVWSGQDAYELGLIDQLGDLDDAVASAALLASISDDYRVEYLEPKPDFTDQLLIDMLAAVSAWTGPIREPRRSVISRIVDDVEQQLKLIQQFDDPRGIYAHCWCEAPR